MEFTSLKKILVLLFLSLSAQAQDLRTITLQPTKKPQFLTLSSVYQNNKTLLWRGSTSDKPLHLPFHLLPQSSLWVETLDKHCNKPLWQNMVDLEPSSKNNLCRQSLKSTSGVISRGNTASTLFIDRYGSGPAFVPTWISDMNQFDKIFSKIGPTDPGREQLVQYFANGGEEALVVRAVGAGAQSAAFTVQDPTSQKDIFIFSASGPGVWGNQISFSIAKSEQVAGLYTLQIESLFPAVKESFHLVSLDPSSSAYFVRILYDNSKLLHVTDLRPWGEKRGELPVINRQNLNGGIEGDDLRPQDVIKAFNNLNEQINFQVIALSTWAYFEQTSERQAVLKAVSQLAQERNLFVILDAPQNLIYDAHDPQVAQHMVSWFNNELAILDAEELRNFAFYFPRLATNIVFGGRPLMLGASGSIAGIYASTDRDKGVWEAPAGIGTNVEGTSGFEYKMTEQAQGVLTPAGINVLRTFPVYGDVVWGARTPYTPSPFQYLSVTRLSQAIHRDIQMGLQAFVYEQQGEQLWGKVRNEVISYLNYYFQNGAFVGNFNVVCDSTINSAQDLDKGLLNVMIQYSPLVPAEYVSDYFQIQVQQDSN